MMRSIQNSPHLFALFLLPTLLSLACSSQSNNSDEIVIAKVDDKEITVNEFKYRSELTQRPNNFKGKNTTLNNLIAEKILALEAEKSGESMNPALSATLKGIKEQAMRDALYYEAAFNQVQVDSQEIKNAFRNSMREYELEFYTVRKKEAAQTIEAVLDSMPELTGEMLNELQHALGQRPVHKVKYDDPDDEVIHQALFTSLLDTGDVLGPLKLSNGDYIIMKVLNWVDYPLVSGHDQRIRWNKVKEKIQKSKAARTWHVYQDRMMSGKKIEFDRQSFEALSQWAVEKHLSDQENDSLRFPSSELPSAKPEVDLGAPFFTIDGETWTVGEFREALMSHPLVFRTKYLDRKNFARHFKFAIIDLMRDHYLTKEAYQRSLDESPAIAKTVRLWEDAYLATQQKKSVIHSALQQGLIHENDQPGMLRYWESYVTDLQKKYSSSIQINHEAFAKISLTNVDLVAIRPGVPYPVAMPGFPMLILSENLDYARQDGWF